MIKAMNEILQNNKNVKLLIVGQGSINQKIKLLMK